MPAQNTDPKLIDMPDDKSSEGSGKAVYQAPTLTKLGSLADMTQDSFSGGGVPAGGLPASG